jgi:hypothetical protein
MVDVPAATGLTVPVEEPIVATEEVPLIHVPPPVEQDKVTEDAPTHKDSVPVIALGLGFTVTVIVLKQAPLR